MLQFNAVGPVALIAVALCWSLAVVLWRTRTVGSVARRLSMLLVVAWVTPVSTGFIDLFLGDAGRSAGGYPA